MNLGLLDFRSHSLIIRVWDFDILFNVFPDSM